MTTSSPVGQHIMLAVRPVEGQSVIAEGLQESLILDGQPHRYTLTSQTVTLRGDVTFLECGKHHRDPRMFCDNRLTSLDISGCKSLETLICQGNDLTSLDVSQNPALKYLACGFNQLSTLDVSYNPALKRLDCYSNKIKREEMTQLVNGLPDRQGKEAGFFVVHSIFPEDETRCLKSDVAIAKAKNWDVVQVSAIDGYGRYKFEPYEGEDDSQPSVGDGVITMTTSRAVGEQIVLAMIPVEGQTVIAEGLKEPLILDGEPHLYTLTSQTVTLRGNLTHLACDGMKDSSIPTGHRDQLTSLDVSGCKTLTYLDCSNNLLQSLDITHNEALTELFCMDNQLTSLDLSQARGLEMFACSGNALTQLNLSQCTNLVGLGVGRNQLTDIDVSQLKKLKFLECDDNQLTRLDVSHNGELQGLACYGNQIKGEAMTELVNGLPNRMGKDPHGEFVVVGKDAKTDGNICLKSDVLIAKLKNWSVLTSDFRTEYDGEPDPAPNPNTPVGDGVITMTTSRAVGEQIMLAVSPVEGQTVIAEGLQEPLILDGKGHLYTLTSQTVTLRGNLTLLLCDGAVDMDTPPSHKNQLTSLDINCETLTLLSCGGNQLTSLDLSHARALTTLGCYENKLTQLDLSPCTKLTGLGVGSNQLTHLDVSQLKKLKFLECDNNQLTRLDVSHNDELQGLACYGNQIKDEAMTELVNGLPNRMGKEPGIFKVIEKDAKTDGNICLKSDVAIAKGKNWSVQNLYGKPYEGEVTAVEAIESLSARIYPNPAQTFVLIDGLQPSSPVKLYSMEGKQLCAMQADAEGHLQIDLTALSDGVYLLVGTGWQERLVVKK